LRESRDELQKKAAVLARVDFRAGRGKLNPMLRASNGSLERLEAKSWKSGTKKNAELQKQIQEQQKQIGEKEKEIADLEQQLALRKQDSTK
jgi:hypothetical protein